MIQRRLFPQVLEALEEAPAVCLLGPRQVGKTTLALAVAEGHRAVSWTWNRSRTAPN